MILLVKTLLSRNFCQKRVRVKFRNFHTVRVHIVEKQEVPSHWRNISSNQLFSNLFGKTVTLTKFPHYGVVSSVKNTMKSNHTQKIS